MADITKEKDYGYGTLSALHGIIHKDSHKFLDKSNEMTLDHLMPIWISQMEENQKNRMWKKHGSFAKICKEMGIGKAVIGVGAGTSFNKNCDVLKFIHDNDGIKSWEDRDFIIMSSNHQFKPLLKMGIIPDFVFLIDGGDMDSVYNQLCVDVPESGKNAILIAPYHVSPRVAKKWTKQKRNILFFLSHTKKLKERFKEITKKNPEEHSIVCGGNVLNTMWMFSAKVFKSKVFMCVGNDLSYPMKTNRKDRELSYYSDGDYSTNAKGTGSGRDEANCKKKWLGFKIKKRNIFVQNKNQLEIVGGEIVGTSHSLWVYKTWIEESMILLTSISPKLGLHYYNCTEGGILGVMAKEFDDKSLRKEENWYMLDEVCKRWHTTTLEHAATQYLRAKEGSNVRNWETLQVPCL